MVHGALDTLSMGHAMLDGPGSYPRLHTPRLAQENNLPDEWPRLNSHLQVLCRGHLGPYMPILYGVGYIILDLSDHKEPPK